VSHRRRIAALFLVAAVVLGTSGYDVVESDRSVDVAVAPDDAAYLGVQPTGGTAAVGNDTTPLTVANNHATAVDVRVRLANHTGDLVLGSGNETTLVGLDPDTGTGVTVTCDAVFDDVVAFDLTATAPNATVETTATARVACG
jgi:hypothetical protein